MATNNVVPRANLEGSIGTNTKRWNNGCFNNISATTKVSAPTVECTNVSATRLYAALGVITPYTTVSDMVADSNLKAGHIAHTLGYYSVGDSGSATYKVRQKANGETTNGKVIILANGLAAEMVIEEYVKPEQFGAKGDGTTDDYNAVQAALDACKSVVLTNGKTYKVNTVLIVNQGQKINLNGATIKRAGGLFINAKKTDTYTGFNGIGNIEIYNGIIEQGEITFIHATNVYIHDIRFQKSAAEHWIEIAGCKRFVIDNCSFEGTVASSSARNYVECIQLDLCNPNAFPYFEDSSNPTYDNTMATEITVTNCNFFNGNGTLYTCIGSHAVLSDGSQYTYITIKGCRFTVGSNTSVRLANVTYGYILDNLFYQNNKANLSLSDSCKSILVQGNSFSSSSYRNIEHSYDLNNGSYNGTDWTFINNCFSFTADNYAIALPYISRVRIINNTISQGLAKNPFAFGDSANIEVRNNTKSNAMYFDELRATSLLSMDVPVRMLAETSLIIATTGTDVTLAFPVTMFNSLELSAGYLSSQTQQCVVVDNYFHNKFAIGSVIRFALPMGMKGTITVKDANTITIKPDETFTLRMITAKVV